MEGFGRLSSWARMGVDFERRLRLWRPAQTSEFTALAAAAAGFVLLALVAAVPVSAAEASKPAATSTGNAENGKTLFVKDGCYECHGRQAQGSLQLGPRLGPDPIPLQALISYVRRPAGEMPPYTEKVISDQELAD